jgi:hypothetical protein
MERRSTAIETIKKRDDDALASDRQGAQSNWPRFFVGTCVWLVSATCSAASSSSSSPMGPCDGRAMTKMTAVCLIDRLIDRTD